jgi:hypothetical protein
MSSADSNGDDLSFLDAPNCINHSRRVNEIFRFSLIADQAKHFWVIKNRVSEYTCAREYVDKTTSAKTVKRQEAISHYLFRSFED